MLKAGDKVKMNDKYYVSEKNRGKVFVVTAGPQEVCGTICVWLEGFRGCYAADGLDKVNLVEMEETKENRIVESLCQVDFSELSLPLVTIYEKPLDFPNAFVARVWDGKGAKPTNIMIKRDTIQKIREDIKAAGFMEVFQRAEDDEPCIVETWM